ncbi:hypothetical protein PZA11_007043 [Diplocarpon coronariae]|nr:hypothetical protein JHW43_009161 [Diplocarpon mali]
MPSSTTISQNTLLAPTTSLESIDSMVQQISELTLTPSPGVNFCSLPTEIRLMIWKLAIPGPRVLRMCIPRDKSRVPWTYSTSSPAIPSILHVNLESRIVGLSLFTLNFPLKQRQCRPPPYRPALSTYWNPARDTLYLPDFHAPEDADVAADVARDAVEGSDAGLPADDSLLGRRFHHHNLMAMQHLALPWKTKVASGFDFRTGSDRCGGEWMPRWLFGFPSLKSVTFVVEPSSRGYRPGEIVLYEPGDARVRREYSCCALAWSADRVSFKPGELAALIACRLRLYTQGEIPNIHMKLLGHRETRKTLPFCVTRSRPRTS